MVYSYCIDSDFIKLSILKLLLSSKKDFTYKLRHKLNNKKNQSNSMEQQTITLDVETFKEMLLYSWHLIPVEKQAELTDRGISPRLTVPKR
jgi:hypothetical protein